MIWTDNPVRDAERYFADQEEELSRLPKCDGCGVPLYDHYFDADGDRLCDDCFHDWCRDNFLKFIEED